MSERRRTLGRRPRDRQARSQLAGACVTSTGANLAGGHVRTFTSAPARETSWGPGRSRERETEEEGAASMHSRWTHSGFLVLVGIFALAGCGDDQDPDGAADLWKRIHAQSYRSWMRAPGFETRKASAAPHGD